jgi:hypothetical protein
MRRPNNWHPHGPLVAALWPLLPRRRGAARRTRHRGRPRHRLPLGRAVHPATGRGGQALPPLGRGSLAGRRDLCESGWPLALCLPCDRSVRAGHRRVRLATSRSAGGRSILRAGYRHDEDHTERGRDRSGADLPDGLGGVAAGGAARHRAVRQQPGRGRPRPPQGEAAADARAQAGPQRQDRNRRARLLAERPPRPLRACRGGTGDPAVAVAFDELALAI